MVKKNICGAPTKIKTSNYVLISRLIVYLCIIEQTLHIADHSQLKVFKISEIVFPTCHSAFNDK